MIDPVVEDVLSGYFEMLRAEDAERPTCRLPECRALGVEKFEGYCVIHWHNLQSWLRRKQ